MNGNQLCSLAPPGGVCAELVAMRNTAPPRIKYHWNTAQTSTKSTQTQHSHSIVNVEQPTTTRAAREFRDRLQRGTLILVGAFRKRQNRPATSTWSRAANEVTVSSKYIQKHTVTVILGILVHWYKLILRMSRRPFGKELFHKRWNKRWEKIIVIMQKVSYFYYLESWEKLSH